jgi:hypothetical protein
MAQETLSCILTTYISGFFDMVLKGEEEPLLSGPSKAYPEVSFVINILIAPFMSHNMFHLITERSPYRRSTSQI